MKKLLLVLGLMLAGCAFAPPEPPTVWEKAVASGMFGGDTYSVIKANKAFCSIEYLVGDDGVGVVLIAGSPLPVDPVLIQMKLITPNDIKSKVQVITVERLPDDKAILKGMKEIPATPENDIFGQQCVGAVKNGVTAGPNGTMIPIPEDVLKAFRGEYGIGK
jgi:hypothetical protein